MEGLFELYELPMWPAPFPRKLLGVYSDYDDLIRDFSLTHSEIEALIDGEIVKEKLQLEIAPEFLRELIIDDINNFGYDRLREQDVAEIVDMSHSAVRQTVRRFKLKQKKNRVLQCTLFELCENKSTSNYLLQTKCSLKYSTY